MALSYNVSFFVNYENVIVILPNLSYPFSDE